MKPTPWYVERARAEKPMPITEAVFSFGAYQEAKKRQTDVAKRRQFVVRQVASADASGSRMRFREAAKNGVSLVAQVKSDILAGTENYALCDNSNAVV